MFKQVKALELLIVLNCVSNICNTHNSFSEETNVAQKVFAVARWTKN